ncbi:MAG: hypothetical protein U1E80_10235 [Piscinibacter sp.]|mgnify:FL=1|jgi:hypothetical protein|uniref:hypothetical protein n=1 Tax=Piscinibacter sp. TaxID=1903157 RepID=UPI0011D4C570|nr:hypothetical protein [Piscinibacter sp.]MBP5990017.1 hypothetical protein [Piscinibacter sp.]MBP6026598.1 hypothetical protein [Piscinibacter sp.]MBS0443812.1 hypothetical protein [Pseudomonadota bacterium]TXI70678.1 MAG: hypothetical protein E6Q49_11630 [Limnohabitans sp.]
MTSHILPSQSFRPARSGGVGQAIGDLALAAARLTKALLSSLRRPVRHGRRLSVIEEANELRQFASSYLRTDPGFAADLMAAADRHELANDKA